MASNESLILDGLQTNDAVTYSLESLSLPVPKKRPEWVGGGDSDGAILGREPLYENRTVQCRVRVEPQATMDLALAAVATLQDKLQEAERGGIDLQWTPADSTKTYTLRVLMGEIDELPIVVQGDDAGWFVKAPVASFSLTCAPFGYGAEVLGTPVTSALPVVTLELAGVGGDVPAEGRLVITDNAAQARRHVEWGIESRHYPTTAPPGLILDSDSLVTAGFAGTGTTRTGAYDPGAVGNNVIRATLFDRETVVCGTGVLTHVGTFRVKARVWATSTAAKVRLTWQDGGGQFRSNPYASSAQVDAFSEIDLGVITLSEVQAGTQRWTGRVDAYGEATSSTLDIDYLLLIPAGEGYGLVRATPSQEPGVLVTIDALNTGTAGAVLNGRVAPLGGSWVSSGAATDFALVATSTGVIMARSTVSDASNRVAELSASTYTNTRVECNITVDLATGSGLTRSGVVARYVDASNLLLFARAHDPDADDRLIIWKYIAGTPVALSTKPNLVLPDDLVLRLTVYATGRAIGEAFDSGGALLHRLTAIDTVLATGGTLATGKPGIVDQNGSAIAKTRYFAFFDAYTPPDEPIAIYPSQSLEVRSDIALREDSTGTYYGPPPSYLGARFTIPVAGVRNRKARVAVKIRRNDVAVNVDDQIADSTTVAAHHTPRFLSVPR